MVYLASELSGEIILLLMHVCVHLSGVYIVQYKVLLELYLESVPSASDLVYACVWPALVAMYGHGLWP